MEFILTAADTESTWKPFSAGGFVAAIEKPYKHDFVSILRSQIIRIRNLHCSSVAYEQWIPFL